MSPEERRPPRLMEWMLEKALPPGDRDPVLGDLAEAFTSAVRDRGRGPASRWYAVEVLRSLLPALMARVRSRPMEESRGARSSGVGSTEPQGLTSSFLDDARAAVRSLRRRPRFTALTAGAYALGIGVVTAAFGLVDDVLLDPLPWPDAEAVVGIWEQNLELGATRVPAAPAKISAWRARADLFTDVAAWRLDQYDLTQVGDPTRLPVGRVEPEIFGVMRVDAALGRVFVPDEARDGRDAVAVLTHGFWVDRFGADPDAVGRALTLDGRAMEIVGVLPEGLHFPEDAEVLVPLVMVPESRVAHAYRVVARLAPGMDVHRASAAMDDLATRMAIAYPDTDRGWAVDVVTLRDQLVGDLRPSLLLLLVGGGLVFFTGCGNAASLLLVRASGRARELAVRTSVGASRSRLVSQLALEAVFVALLGGSLGLLLARWTTAGMARLAPADVQELVGGSFDLTVYVFALVLAVSSGLLFGLLPAVRGTAVDPRVALREGGGLGSPRDARLRSMVVAGEIALAAVLVVGSSLLLRSSASLGSVDLGYDASGWMTSELRPAPDRYPDEATRLALYDAIVERAGAVPGVQGAALVNHVPLAGRADLFRFQVEGRAVERFADLDVVELRSVTPGYFQVMGIGVSRGRGFGATDDSGGALVAVVDEGMAERYWPGEDPLGQRISFSGEDGPWVRIVGMVESVRQDDPAVTPDPAVYVPLSQQPWPSAWMVVRSEAGVEGLAGSVRDAVAQVDPLLPVGTFVAAEDLLGEALDRWRLQALLVSLFAATALLLAATGLYGLMAYVVHQRTGEIAVRRVLGARSAEIGRQAGADALCLALVGVGAGYVVSASASRLLERFLYGVPALDPLSYAAAGLLVILFTAVATWAPVRSASRVDPARALRAD